MVGIWGLGGGGKTTLAYALYDEISCQFDGCCFVKNVREESSKHGLEELQKKIISDVLKIKKEEVVGDVRMLIKNRLCRKKVLLVLDDVADANHLKALAGSHNWFNDGSRIIITTRDRHLLNIQQVNVIYNISLLNNDEAMKLFCKHALRLGNYFEDYDSISEEVVSYAHGLPLALKVMGSLLCDKDKSEWVSALARLNDIADDGIMETLKISYDGLKPMEQVLFLDIAYFFRGSWCKCEMWVVLEACGLHPKIGIKALKEKALLTVSKEGWFDMHDLIQEMAHFIVREKYPQNPEKHSRVWREEDVVKICATPTEENHWIETLKVWNTGEKVHPNLPGAIANMKELRWISWRGYPETSLPANFQSTKLSYLGLHSSYLNQLLKGDKILPSLKVLDLSCCHNLIATPDFYGLPCLERVILKNCNKLTCIHPSIGYHERLISVEMQHCSDLKMFPPIIGMKKLETLDLSGCSSLSKFPEIQMNMDNLVELSLRETGIKVVPSSIGQYCTNLFSLDLGGCRSLESIEGNFHPLKYLKKLFISGCKELKIPAEGLLDVNCGLEELETLDTTFNILHPFLGFPHLKRLRLGMGNWINEADISSVFCELPNLQVLDIGWNDFSRLPFSLLQLRSLKYLSLSHCYKLVELPDLPESIAILGIGSEEIKLVDIPTNLRWLQRISLPIGRISGDFEREVQSMLQGNAINDRSISFIFNRDKGHQPQGLARRIFMLELPRNWCNEFSGFLISINAFSFSVSKNCVFTIEDVMGRENEDVLEVCYETPLETLYATCCIYISFGSLRRTSWWKSKHTTISFSIEKPTNFNVELVPGRSKGDSIERVKGTTNSSKLWDKEPIEIIHDSKSCIQILWRR